MAAPDAIHKAVKNALVKDGWTITDDPYTMEYEDVRLFADLGAERPLAAERAGRRLVVEGKSFRGLSRVRDFEQALGQYLLYRAFLEVLELDRELFLAVSDEVHDAFFQLNAIQFVLERYAVRLVVINLEQEEIVQWINLRATEI